MESGNHVLRDYALFFDSNLGSNIFIMFSGSKGIPTITNVSQYFQISGITLTGYNGGIEVRRAQEVVISDCNFHGVRIRLGSVTNATITRCTFSLSGHYNPNGFVNVVFISEVSALTVYNSALLIDQCNFYNNEVAVNVMHYSVMDLTSLRIRESVFVNNTSHYNGQASAVSVYVNLYYGSSYYQYSEIHDKLLSIRDSVFINNTFKHYGGGAVEIFAVRNNRDVYLMSIMNCTFSNNTSQQGAGALTVNGDNVQVSILECVFTNNTSLVGAGALYINVDRHQGLVQYNIFTNNNAVFSRGVAIHYTGRYSNLTLTGNSFMYSSADACGALSIQCDGNSTVTVNDNTFYHNI